MRDKKVISSKTDRAKRCDILRKLTAQTLAALAKEIGVSKETVRSWEKGIAGGLTEKGASQLEDAAIAFNVKVDAMWLLYGIGDAPKIIKQTEQEEITPKQSKAEKAIKINSYIEEFLSTPNTLAFEITDESMLPFYEIGDILGCEIIDEPQKENSDCVITLADDTQLCRTISHAKAKNKYNYSCYNTDANTPNLFKNNTKLKQIAAIRIIWKAH
ncbi:MAG: helix-turn-helix transcriptional regulator [Gammaproteobacteria bacterium]|nr:helix-turn-helix transcriptional regulator [Gammaproteobacteria bacterium]